MNGRSPVNPGGRAVCPVHQAHFGVHIQRLDSATDCHKIHVQQLIRRAFREELPDRIPFGYQYSLSSRCKGKEDVNAIK